MYAKSTKDEISNKARYRDYILPAGGFAVMILLFFISFLLSVSNSGLNETIKTYEKQMEEYTEQPKGEIYCNLINAKIVDLKKQHQILNTQIEWQLSLNNSITPIAAKNIAEEKLEAIKKKAQEENIKLSEDLGFPQNLPEAEKLASFSARLQVSNMIIEELFKFKVKSINAVTTKASTSNDKLIVDGEAEFVIPNSYLALFLKNIQPDKNTLSIKKLSLERTSGALPDIMVNLKFQTIFSGKLPANAKIESDSKSNGRRRRAL